MRVLVLSGGGSHGAWQAGAIKALCSKYSYDAIVGTSVGSVNAVGLSFLGPNEIESLWLGLKGTDRIMKLNLEWPWKSSGLYSFSPLKEFIADVLRERTPTIPAYITSLDLASGVLCHDIATADIGATVDLLAGSCAIAGIQSPTNGRVDGGHRDVSPIRFALNELQASEVHAVYADPVGTHLGAWSQWKTFPIIGIMLRALACMIDEITSGDIPDNDSRVRVFQPSEPLPYSSLSYEPAKMSVAFSRGYEETLNERN
jgi:predicted acylesterase/phospholipase RssA